MNVLTHTGILWGWIEFFNLVLVDLCLKSSEEGMNKGVVSLEFSGLTFGVGHGGMRS